MWASHFGRNGNELCISSWLTTEVLVSQNMDDPVPEPCPEQQPGASVGHQGRPLGLGKLKKRVRFLVQLRFLKVCNIIFSSQLALQLQHFLFTEAQTSTKADKAYLLICTRLIKAQTNTKANKAKTLFFAQGLLKVHTRKISAIRETTLSWL